MYMKRRMLILLSACLLLALLPHGTMPAVRSAEGVLRLHILANSDSEADQALKLPFGRRDLPRQDLRRGALPRRGL